MAAPENPARSAATMEGKPRVWIFCGTPGDEEHHVLYEQLLGRLRSVFAKRYEVGAEDLVVLYGPKSADYDGECTRDALLAECAKIVAASPTPDARPVWILLIGHANAIAGGAFYNLPGPDLSSHDLGEALQGAKGPMVVFATTACSASFLRPLAGTGRIVATANIASDEENETEFPDALAKALENPETDANGDGFVSVLELFLACHEGVREAYESRGLMIREHSQLDGDGDGRATQRPASIDSRPASAVGLPVAPDAAHRFN